MEKRVPNCLTDSYVIFSRYEVSHDHVPGILVETAAYRKSRSKWQEMECTRASTFKRFMCMYIRAQSDIRSILATDLGFSKVRNRVGKNISLLRNSAQLNTKLSHFTAPSHSTVTN